MVVARNFRVEERDGNAYLLCDLSSETFPAQLWFSTPASNVAALNADEPNWAALALLWPAMLLGEDIEIEGAISDRLLYFMQNDIAALFTIHEPRLKRIRITAEAAPSTSAPARPGFVATGFSAGIDSFATLSLYRQGLAPPEFNPTHLTVFNVGGLGDMVNSGPLFQKYVERGKMFATENDYQFISVDSNVDEIYKCAKPAGPVGFQKTHTLRNATAAAALSNVVSTYLYSASVSYRHSKAIKAHDMAFMDSILLPLFSTSRLSFLSAGSGLSRIEKARLVAERADARAMLDVCVVSPEQRVSSDKPNCSRCWKCGRTLVVLEALGRLDDFGSVFDLEVYRSERPRLLTELVELGASGDLIAADAAEFARAQGIRMPWSSLLTTRFHHPVRKYIGRRAEGLRRRSQ